MDFALTALHSQAFIEIISLHSKTIGKKWLYKIETSHKAQPPSALCFNCCLPCQGFTVVPLFCLATNAMKHPRKQHIKSNGSFQWQPGAGWPACLQPQYTSCVVAHCWVLSPSLPYASVQGRLCAVSSYLSLPFLTLCLLLTFSFYGSSVSHIQTNKAQQWQHSQQLPVSLPLSYTFTPVTAHSIVNIISCDFDKVLATWGLFFGIILKSSGGALV